MKKLSIMMAAMALVAIGCDPYEDEPGGAPAVDGVVAMGRAVLPVAGEANESGGWVIDDAFEITNDADGNGEVSDAEAEASADAALNQGVPVGAGGNNVILVTTNRLLDGATIQTAPQDPTDAASTGDCRPANGWLQIQKTVGAGAQEAEPLSYSAGAARCEAAAAPSPFQWYSCYYPSAASNRLGSSIEIFRARANQAPGLTTATRPFSIARFQTDTTYVITGTVKDSSGQDLPINVQLKTALGQPAAVNAYPNGDGTVTVEWTGISTAEAYDVYRLTAEETAEAPARFADIADVAPAACSATTPSVCTFTEARAANEDGYTYFVVARNSRSRSPASAEATVLTGAPEAPTDVAAEPGANDVCTPEDEPSTTLVVTWSGTNAREYIVESAPAATGPWTVEATVDALTDGTEYVDTGIAPETTVFYRVTAVTGIGSSAPSEAGEGETEAAPTAP